MSQQDEVRSPRKLQYGIGALLVFTALVAAFLGLGTWLRWDGMYVIVVFVLLITGAGYLAGWLGRSGTGGVRGIIIPAIVFIGMNWTLWYINGRALSFVVRATERDLNAIVSTMADAYRSHFFDVMAVLGTVVIAVAAMKRNQKYTFLAGSVSLLGWVLLVVVGYVNVSICLIDLK